MKVTVLLRYSVRFQQMPEELFFRGIAGVLPQMKVDKAIQIVDGLDAWAFASQGHQSVEFVLSQPD